MKLLCPHCRYMTALSEDFRKVCICSRGDFSTLGMRCKGLGLLTMVNPITHETSGTLDFKLWHHEFHLSKNFTDENGV